MKRPSWQLDKHTVIVALIILVVYFATSFDVCNYPSQPEPNDKGFIFSGSWNPEHLHTSECYAVFYQTAAFSEGRTWITEGVPPDLSTDCVEVAGKYYQVAEPVTAALLVPFYTMGHLFFGDNYVIRSVMTGMMIFTLISALLVQRISLSFFQNRNAASLAALLFAFATMAFTYAKLLYPQPVTAMLMFLSIMFLLNFKADKRQVYLGLFAFFYALTVFSFNVFIITAPFFLYYIFRIDTGFSRKKFAILTVGLLPITILFFAWNITTTGNLFETHRQLIHHSMTFDVLYTTADGTWLNLEGIVGSLFSPVGIFFVSPILLAAFLSFNNFKKDFKDEAFLFSSIIIIFWLFMSFANLGGSIQRDFWIGGWASIARYMYIPSTLLAIFAGFAFLKIRASSGLVGAWLYSLGFIISFMANLSYSVRHDLMVGFFKDIKSTSLLIWPVPISASELELLLMVLLVVSLVFPAYLYIIKHSHNRKSIKENETANLQPPTNPRSP